MIAPNDATRAQILAARPNVSTWVGANAGSGKTRVLTDRVARLLLNGVEPQKILCLTYTKAAASEMQNRLFARLGSWAMLSDDALRQELMSLDQDQILSPTDLKKARTLFARAIETPGGLKIQTIHSFCASILRRFPLEAQVSPNFSEMDDRAGALLRAEIIRDMARGPARRLMETVAARLSGNDFDDFTKALVTHRAGIPGGQTLRSLAPRFGLPPEARPEDALHIAFIGGETRLLKDLTEQLAKQSKSYQADAEVIAAIPRDPLTLASLHALIAFFTDSKGALKLGRYPTTNHKAARAAVADTQDEIDALIERLSLAREYLSRIAVWHATADLHAFAEPFLRAYQDRKLLRGWLDFDDLIVKARDLLSRSDVASWVLYRLDGGIDHILVDEAQDTNPLQWQVIDLLSQEFTSGEGARPNQQRTMFVVGDKKQSIYSFQGADPREFDRMRERFSERLAPSGAPLHVTGLRFSFRSSARVLSLVDRAFDGRESSGFEPDAAHIAFHADLPGRVDLWPPETPADKQEPPAHATMDWVATDHHEVRLARRIADAIREMLEKGTLLPVAATKDTPMHARPVLPGDILILVQRRSSLFGHIIRACKAANLPIAGSDRLKVGAELAVRDLAALLSALATPEDDLALATALRSPLFDWSEQALFTLAHARGDVTLWAKLHSEAAVYGETVSVLTELAGQADFLRPYDLLERILIRHDGRRRLLARLGAEAEDGIDAFLAQALAYEQNDVPSLTGFLGWMETDALEVKRQMDGSTNEIRVMTVHGAKGLESPIVILPDTMDRRDKPEDRIVLHDGFCWWWPNKKEWPDSYAAIREARLEAIDAENDRLLYVAMTRAEKWLILAGAGSIADDSDGWYARLEAAMRAANAASHPFEGGAGLRIEDASWHALPQLPQQETPPTPPQKAEAFYQHPPAKTPDAPRTISPSNLGGAKALPGEGQDTEDAKQFGTLVHRLLERLPDLPQSNWSDAARALSFWAPTAMAAAALTDAQRVLTSPELASYFQPGALIEVPISADIPGFGRLYGLIDRLIVTDTHVLAIDYKSNRVVPASFSECPEGLLRQMGAYAAALSAVFPQHEIQTAILWTATATLMSLPHDAVSAAFARVTSLDAPPPGP